MSEATRGTSMSILEQLDLYQERIEMEEWKEESLKQAVARLIEERNQQIAAVIRAAGMVH